MQELRAASYAAVRLMDTALMSWVSYWAEARDLAQKAEFFRAGREVQLQLQVLREWREVAGQESQDRVAWDRWAGCWWQLAAGLQRLGCCIS
jgi:hypothetical protein